MKRVVMMLTVFCFTVCVSGKVSFSNGTLSGWIQDQETGKPLARVNVEIEGTPFGSATDEQGFFLIQNLAPGKYTVTVKRIGYNLLSKEGVRIQTKEITELNFNLSSRAIKFSEVVVTATRSPKLLTDVSASTEVLTAKELNQINAQNVGEALLSIGGVYVKNYGDLGALKMVSLRGSSAEQVLVLLDGQKLNDSQSGDVDFSHIPLNAIERIEIVRGGHSALYGADAVGGVINIITKRVGYHERFSGSAQSTLGSFGTGIYQFQASQRISKLFYSLSYNRTESEGDYKFKDASGKQLTRQNNRLQWDDLFLKFGYDVSKKSHLNLFTQYHRSNQGVPGSLGWPSKKAQEIWDKNIFQLNFDHHINDRLNVKFHSFINQFDHRYKNPEAFEDSRHKNNSYGFGLHNRSLIGEWNSLTMGFEYRRDMVSSTDLADYKRDIGSVFLQDEIIIASAFFPYRLSLIPAARYDSYSDIGSAISPKIGFMFNWIGRGTLGLRGNVSRSFRVPTFNDLYWPDGPWSAGNPELLPEYGFNWDGGIVFQYPGARCLWGGELTYFVNNLENLIIWAPRADGKWTPQNINESLTKGIETKFLWSGFQDFINVEMSYTYMEARNNTPGSPLKDKFVIYRPKNKIDVNWGIKFKILRLNTCYTWVDKRFTTKNNSCSLPAYGFININLGFALPWGVKAKLGVNNLLDKSFSVMEDYPVPGREARFTLGIGG